MSVRPGVASENKACRECMRVRPGFESEGIESESKACVGAESMGPHTNEIDP